MIPGRRPTFSDSGGMAVPPFESQVCRPTVTLGRPGTGSCLTIEGPCLRPPCMGQVWGGNWPRAWGSTPEYRSMRATLMVLPATWGCRASERGGGYK